MIGAALVLALASRGDEPRFLVYDARDRSPIAGATLELWTEEGHAPIGAMTRLAVVRAGDDGTGPVAYAIDGIRFDDARVSSPGYASRTVGSSDLEDGVGLYPEEPLRGRVVDLEGRPVAGALVRSRETCAHAVAASETTTDALGRFEMTDFPADSQHAELEVVPREHLPLAHVDAAALRRIRRRDGAVDVHVAAGVPLAVRVVDELGLPIVGERIFWNTEPCIGGWLDDQGRVRLPPAAGPTAQLELHRGSRERVVFVDGPPASGELVATPVGVTGPRPRGRLTIDVGDPGPRPAPRVLAIASNGARADAAGAASLPLGPSTVVVGQTFTPWVEESRAVEVTAEDQVVAFRPKPAAVVDVVLPEGPWATLWVQAGAAGRRHDLEGGRQLSIDVPPAVEIVLVAVSGDGEIRRLRVPPIAGGSAAAADLRGDAARVRAGAPAPPEAR